MADRATSAVLGRVRVEPRRGRKTGEDPSIGVATGLRRRRAPREGAWVTELTGLMDLSDWPTGMCVIARAERPHPNDRTRATAVHRCQMATGSPRSRRT